MEYLKEEDTKQGAIRLGLFVCMFPPALLQFVESLILGGEMGVEIEITSANFDSEINSGVALIDFWASWCAPCRMQGPILEKVAEHVADKAKIGKCNVDDQQGLAAKFGVQSIPTLIVFKDGAEVERLIGLQSEKVLLEKLNELALTT